MALDHIGLMSRNRSFLLVGFAYLLALLVAIITGWLNSDRHPLIVVALADVCATCVIFIFSLVFRNSSFYDPYWSVAPPVICVYLWMIGDTPNSVRSFTVMTLVWIWAVRLTHNWAKGWQGIRHADWRYVNLQRTLGIYWWPVSFFGIHMMPTVMVYLGCLALYPIFASQAGALNFLDLCALAMLTSSIWIETVADLELHRFRARRPSNSELLTSGVWSWCRHPNYLGELGFWLGLAITALAAGPGNSWTMVGPITMLCLFLVVSIPMIENRLTASKPAYIHYKSRSFALLPISALRGRN